MALMLVAVGSQKVLAIRSNCWTDTLTLSSGPATEFFQQVSYYAHPSHAVGVVHTWHRRYLGYDYSGVSPSYTSYILCVTTPFSAQLIKQILRMTVIKNAA